MKIELWWIGKTQFNYLDTGIEEYVRRLKHYVNFAVRTIDDVKNASKLNGTELKKKEAQKVLGKLKKEAFLVLMDERGKAFDSNGFSTFIENHLNYNSKDLIFLIGGAFGFDHLLYERADAKVSLSKMTFSHQMVRLFCVEQLYRALTIINHEKYHNP